MKIDLKKVLYYVIYIFMIFSNVIYINDFVSKTLDFVLLFFLLVLILCLNLHKKNKVDSISVFLIIILIFLSIIQVIFNEYGCFDIIKNTIYIIVAFIMFYLNTININKKIDVADIFLFLFLLYYLIKSIKTGIVASSVGSFTLSAISDKNWSSFAIFIIFIIFYNKHFKIGAVLSIIYIILLKSRMVQLGLILFVILDIMKDKKNVRPIFEKISNIKGKKIFLIIMISQILLVAFSWVCVEKIPIKSITVYRESLMDNSNAMRMRSNVYTIDRIKIDNWLIVRGYDNSIKSVMGVEDIRNSTVYKGFRLVQPHSLLMNLILRYGIVYSIVYLMLISLILRKYWDIKNIPLLIVYLLMNMILHLLFSMSNLIFLMFILSLNSQREESYKTNIKKEVKSYGL